MLVACFFYSSCNVNENKNEVEEENKEILLLVVEQLFNNGDTLVADKYFAPAFAEKEKAFTKRIRSAFPDLKIKVDMMVAEQDIVAVRWIASGSHKDTFLGVEPTGKAAVWTGSWFWTFKDGKITDGDGKGSWDALGLLKQLQTK